MCSLRFSGPFVLTALLTVTLSSTAHAQPFQPHPLQIHSSQISYSPAAIQASFSTSTGPAESIPADTVTEKLLDAPCPPAPTAQPTDPTTQQFAGSILGTVQDIEGAEIPHALVTLENTGSKTERTLVTDETGFFKFDAVEPGHFNLTVTSAGFSPWVANDLALHTGESYDIPSVELVVASAVTSIAVTATPHDIAEEQMHFEEKQRVLGIIPNFYVSYVWTAAPLSTGQKFRLAVRTLVDPVSIAIPAVIAGVEQSQNSFSGYGQGARGYAKRFGASYTDSLTSTMLTDAILPSILHQDPRYFYKGAGSIRSRALYAIAAVVICKGDNGRWQPNYSNLIGNLASAGISNLYYPSSDRMGVRLTIDNWLIGNASGAVGTLFQEFLVKKLSRGLPRKETLN
jgi:Carboxypeptidase regulatory-like domain